MKVCSRCILSETFPRISFDDEGVCNFCREYDREGDPLTPELMAANSREFDRLIESRRGKGRYDCLVGMSGGKDSTYTACVLKEKYGLNILGYTFDNGFLSRTAMENISLTVDRLGLDHVLFRPRFDVLRELFAHFVMRAEGNPAHMICPACSAFYQSFAKMTARTHGISFVIFGWAAEQDQPNVRIGRSRAYLDAGGLRKCLDGAFSAESSAYIRDMLAAHMHNWFPRSLALLILKRIPEQFFKYTASKYPMVLTPFKAWGYDPEKHTNEVVDRGLIVKGKADSRDTNCLMIHLFNYVNYRQLGYSPFIGEFADCVRKGKLERAKWLGIFEEIRAQVEDGTYRRQEIAEVLEKLGLTEIYKFH